MMYTSVLAAVVSALSAEAIDNTSKQAWQKLYSPHNEGMADLSSLAQGHSGDLSRVDVECWVFARLHSQLIPRHWDALVAKFSTHKARKVEAIGKLVPLVATPAPQLFRYKAVTAWAIPPVKGLQARSGQEVASRSAKELAEFQALDREVRKHLSGSGNGVGDTQARRDQYVKRSTDMIVLPAQFYDMTTWDNDGRPEPTKRRWRGNIVKVLDEMVSEALKAAETVLLAEGILLLEVA